MVAFQVHVILCSASMTRCPFISSFIYPSVLAGVQSEQTTPTIVPLPGYPLYFPTLLFWVPLLMLKGTGGKHKPINK